MSRERHEEKMSRRSSVRTSSPVSFVLPFFKPFLSFFASVTFEFLFLTLLLHLFKKSLISSFPHFLECVFIALVSLHLWQPQTLHCHQRSFCDKSCVTSSLPSLLNIPFLYLLWQQRRFRSNYSKTRLTSSESRESSSTTCVGRGLRTIPLSGIKFWGKQETQGLLFNIVMQDFAGNVTIPMYLANSLIVSHYA